MAGLITLIIIASIVALLYYSNIFRTTTNKEILNAPFPEEWKQILDERVKFYRNLPETEKERFHERIKVFLSEVRITGVETEIDDTIRVLVAASAVIPVFSFPAWHYVNLGEILIYDGLVETKQREEADNKNKILGQVRPFQSRHLLLLSKPSLLSGFQRMNDRENVGFHEFAHLIDEADGAIDGIPRAIIPQELLQPWTELMFKEIERIRKGKSDINPYGVTNHAEFFAVVCEYFLEHPERFKEKHEDLYLLLEKAFKRNKR